MKHTATGVFVAILLLTVGAAFAEDETPDPWQPIRFLLGSWSDGGSGMGGNSDLTHTYELVLQGNFIRFTTDAQFEAAADGAPGEHHEDWGMFSYDPDEQVLVLRQFLTEGYVNTYVHKPTDDGVLVFETRETEGAGGFGARITWEHDETDVYHMTLELRPPEKEWFGCRSMELKRAK